MFTFDIKICEICGAEFTAQRSAQKYCPECGNDPAKARRTYSAAVTRNKLHAGDLYKAMEKVCENCGKTFITTYPSRKFCSNDCSTTFRINHAVCPVCHTKLIDKGITAGQGYCSEECKNQAKLQEAIRNGRYSACEQCGKNFIHPKENSRFCSRACAEAYRSTHKRSAPAPSPKIQEKVCPVCGKTFSITPQQTTKQFCSIECRKTAAAAKPAALKTPKARTSSSESLCLSCRTSQSVCERFTSKFKRLPEGAEVKLVKGSSIVFTCPKYKA